MSQKILIASDHGGFEAKAFLMQALGAAGYKLIDLGTHNTESCDYPERAAELATRLQAGEARFGILICGTGIGMQLTANRFAGVRATVAHEEFSARMARQHNDANVICFGARLIAAASMERLAKIFLETSFEGGRHQKRVAMIEAAAKPH